MIPQLIAASAKLKIGLKNIKCSPPTNGIHVGYICFSINNFPQTRVCLENAFCKMCVTACGTFVPQSEECRFQKGADVSWMKC